MGHCKSSAKGKVHSNTGIPQETSQINNLTLHLKQLEKEEMKNHRVSRKKEILKIRAETKETIAKIKKAKSWFFERINKIDKPLARMELRLPLEMSPGREAACRAVFGTWGFFRTMHGKTAPSC